jgi:hypothetical protein
MPDLPGGDASQERERRLAAAVRSEAGVCVLTGGQTGVDTAAALAALAAGLAVHLVFPRGLRQEDGPLPDRRRRVLAGADLHELASPDFSYRTWTCAYLADAVVLIDPAGGAGCHETRRAARSLGRPLLDLGSVPGAASAELAAAEARPAMASGQVAAWLADVDARVVMVAGCRGSLLAAAGCGNVASAQVAEVTAGALIRHATLIGPPRSTRGRVRSGEPAMPRRPRG